MRFWFYTLALLTGLSLTAVWIQSRERPEHPPLIWSTSHSPAREAEIEAFNRLNPDLRLALDHADYDLRRIILQSSSGIGPDLLEVWTGQYLQEAVEAGIALPLDELVESHGLLETEELSPSIRQEVSYRNRRYGSPLSLQTDLLIYNRNIFDRFGVAYPHNGLTWKEFTELAGRVTHLSQNPAESVYGVVYMRWEYLFYGLKGEFFSSDGTRILIDREPMRRAVSLYRDMIQRHRITLPMKAVNTFATQGGSGAGEFGGAYRQLFVDGRFAMVFRPKSMLVYLRYALETQKEALKHWEADPNRNPEARPEIPRIGAVMPPRFEGRETAYWVRSRSAVVNRFSSRREEALRFLSFLSTPEYSRTVNRHYAYLPPHPRYRDLGVGDGYPELDERAAHENSKRALAHGHQTRKSPFLMDLEVKREIDHQLDRLIANPSLSVEQALSDAHRALRSLMQRNLERDPQLAELYFSRAGVRDPTETAE